MMARTLIRLTCGIDVIEAVQRANEDRDIAKAAANRMAEWSRTAAAERDAALDQVRDLTAELETLLKTNGMFRSLIGILRDCNRELDERNVYLEKLHGMTPGERLATAESLEANV